MIRRPGSSAFGLEDPGFFRLDTWDSRRYKSRMGQRTLDYSLADWLRLELKRRDMGVRTLARLIDPERVDSVRRQLTKYLTGETWPEDEWRQKIAAALDIAVDELPTREDA